MKDELPGVKVCCFEPFDAEACCFEPFDVEVSGVEFFDCSSLLDFIFSTLFLISLGEIFSITESGREIKKFLSLNSSFASPAFNCVGSIPFSFKILLNS